MDGMFELGVAVGIIFTFLIVIFLGNILMPDIYGNGVTEKDAQAIAGVCSIYNWNEYGISSFSRSIKNNIITCNYNNTEIIDNGFNGYKINVYEGKIQQN